MVGHGGSGRVKCWGHASTILDVHHYSYKGKRGEGEENIEGGGGNGGQERGDRSEENGGREDRDDVGYREVGKEEETWREGDGGRQEMTDDREGGREGND